MPDPKRLLIVSDAWTPQINGVVRSLQHTVAHLKDMGFAIEIMTPDETSALPLPFYREIRLDFFGYNRLRRAIESFKPDYIHIATEGPLGWTARYLCLDRGLAFSTAYHTRFPEYLAARTGWFGGAVQHIAYVLLRLFHAPSGAILVPTPSVAALLRQNGFPAERIKLWSRGVDTALFRPRDKNQPAYAGLPRPIALYVGRVSTEKNIHAFLDADLPGSKVVVGDGPLLPTLRAGYPAVLFAGAIADPAELALYYAGADLFVFPSKSDTFGLVILEALASGLPVAACPAPGPQDIFAAGAEDCFFRLDDDLAAAARALLAAPVAADIPHAFAAAHFGWDACTRQFAAHVQEAAAPAHKNDGGEKKET